MKMNKKKVLVSAIAVGLIAILSFGTIAWFSASDEVTNNFKVAGGEDQNPEDIFSVDVMEAVDADNDGDYDYTGADKTVGVNPGDDSYTYENIVPNDLLLKRVSTKNTGSYDQWIRMKVTVSGEFVSIMDKYGIYFTDILEDKDSLLGDYLAESTRKPFNTDGKWAHVKYSDVVEVRDDEDKLIEKTYIFYYNEKLAKDKSAILFSVVHIPSVFTQADMATLNAGAFSMKIVGEAVQADHTANSAREAFALVEQTQPFN